MKRPKRNPWPAVAGLLAVLIAVLAWSLFGGGDDGRTVRAEFEQARGLVPGNSVRINGAPAGEVAEMELTDAGTALVTLRLDEGTGDLRSNASAAIRPVDLLGDTYVALDPGDAPDPLRGEIGLAHTINAPRLDDLLRTFAEPERAALKAMLVEAGVALDARGADFNEAVLTLRPALVAADDLTAEAGSQNASLRDLVEDLSAVTAQAADRNDDLGRLVGAFDATLHATRDHAAGLDQTLAGLPPTLTQLDETTTELEATARTALPLTESLRTVVPELSRAAPRLRPFLETTTRVARSLHPALRRAGIVLDRNDPTLVALANGLGRVHSATPSLASFLSVLAPAAPGISEGFFQNFPDQAAEPGRQPFDPNADPRRHYWRGAAVLTCQSFGLPIRPGCLQDFLGLPLSARNDDAGLGAAEQLSPTGDEGNTTDPGSGDGGDSEDSTGDDDSPDTPGSHDGHPDHHHHENDENGDGLPDSPPGTQLPDVPDELFDYLMGP